jgi:hypothetical protein
MEELSPSERARARAHGDSIDTEMFNEAAQSAGVDDPPEVQCATCGAVGPALEGFWKPCGMCPGLVCIACFTPFAEHEQVRCMNCMLIVYRQEVESFDAANQEQNAQATDPVGSEQGNESVHSHEPRGGAPDSPPDWGDGENSPSRASSPDEQKTPDGLPGPDKWATEFETMSLPADGEIVVTDEETEAVKEDPIALNSYVEMFATAERRANAPVMKPLWETGFMANVFGNIIGFLDRKPERPRAIPMPVEALEIETQKNIAHEVALNVNGPRFRKRRPWLEDLAEKRQVAVAAWKYVLDRTDVTSKTGGFMKALKENEAMHVLIDTLEEKATSTIKQRAESMINYQRWAVSSGRPPYPPSEEVVYVYVAEMRQNKAPATRAARFKESLNFAKHTFGMIMEDSIFESKRISGAILASTKRKRMLVQRDPMTVEMVRKLEALVQDDEVAAATRIFIGFVLLMIHTRARFSDAMHIASEPLVEGEWLEAETAQYKQANQPHRRNKFLYLVGMAKGISGTPWAAAWLQLRREAGLVADKKAPFMPTQAPGGRYTRSALTLWEYTLWLRDVLKTLGVSVEILAKLGSHSCKATTLSWMAKGGLAKDDRKWLGGHLERNEMSMASYSRDMLAGPLRRMKRLMTAITLGEFKPDESRSGRWASEEAAEAVVDSMVEAQRMPATDGQDEVQVDSSTGTASTSVSSSESSSSNSGEPEAQIEAAENAQKRYKPAGREGQPMWKHVRYGTYHLQKVGEQELACSRPLNNYVRVEDVGFVFPKCRICFGSGAGEMSASLADG